MRIACITSSWPSREHPVAGTFVREHARLLEGAGHDVTTFTWRPGTYAEDVVVVAPLGRASVLAGSGAPDAIDAAPWRALEAPLAIGAMLRELRRHSPFDLYLGHWLVPGGLVARLAADAVGRPSFVVGHSAGVHALAALPRVAREPLLDEIVRPGSTTVPSLALAEKLGREVDVLPMGFDAIDVEPAQRRGVLCYGRLVPLKGFDLAVRVATSLDLDLHIVGTGPEAARLRQLAPDATFWGFADAAMKSEVFALCDRALVPSRVVRGRHEGWPVSVLEVASAGVVPFVADWPGARELVVDAAQVVDDTLASWARACIAHTAPLRAGSVAHARQHTWAALKPRWLEQLT